MEKGRVNAIGMLWFTNSRNYTEFLDIFEDRHVMPPTFARWSKLATDMYEQLLREGAFVIKAQASPNEFMAWCAEAGHGLNADGRMAFGAFKAMQKFQQAYPPEE